MDKRIAEFEGSPSAMHVAELLIDAEAEGESKMKLATEWIKLINCKKNMHEGGNPDPDKKETLIDVIRGEDA